MVAKEMKSFRLSEETLRLLEHESKKQSQSVTSILEECVKNQLGDKQTMKVGQIIQLLEREGLVEQEHHESIVLLNLTGKKVTLYPTGSDEWISWTASKKVLLHRRMGAFEYKNVENNTEYFFMDDLSRIAVEQT